MNTFERIRYEYYKGNSAIRQIILINGAFFVFSLLVNLLGFFFQADVSSFMNYFYLPSDLGELVLKPWTLLTNIFFHSTRQIFHIFGNMLILYFIGRVLQDFLNRSQIWTIFIAGGIAGGLFFLTALNVFPVFADSVGHWVLLGASGGVTAIVVATGMHVPFYEVRLFGVYRIQMRWLALALVVMDLVTIPSSSNVGGIMAHIGGAAFGVLYILDLQGRIKLPRFSVGKPKMKTAYHDESKRNIKKERPKPEQEEIDAILDKISQSGYNSLSEEEKAILFKASK